MEEAKKTVGGGVIVGGGAWINGEISIYFRAGSFLSRAGGKVISCFQMGKWSRL